MFYGSAQDNGGPSLRPPTSSPTATSSGTGPAATPPAWPPTSKATGTLYQYFWPCCGGDDTDFFQVNGVGRTSGLLQASGGQPTPDPQWPFTGGANFAVDPVNGQDVVISSAVGRIFATTNEGVTWFDIGDPAVFGSPGSFSVALAYGAPDPNAPEGVGNLGNFIYVGTANGTDLRHPGRRRQRHEQQLAQHLHSAWTARPSSRSSPTPPAAATTPTPSPPPACSIIADSILLGEQPRQHRYEWVNITGNLKTLAYTIFGQTYNPTTDPNSTKYNQAVSLSSIVADWRYAIPNSPDLRQRSRVSPVLYVGAGNSSAPARACINRSTTARRGLSSPTRLTARWRRAAICPMSPSPSLSLSLGNIRRPNTGMPDPGGPVSPRHATQSDRGLGAPIPDDPRWPRPTAKASLPSTWRR